MPSLADLGLPSTLARHRPASAKLDRGELRIRFVEAGAAGRGSAQPDRAPGRYRRWLDELREPPSLRPYPDFAALADRMQKSNPRLTRVRAAFLAEHWGRRLGDGTVALRGDPAHKIINPMLYQYEEVRACWNEVKAPVLWVDASDTPLLKRAKITAEDHAARRAAFAQLRYVTVQDAGHMLHHDQPEAVARLIEEFFDTT